LKKTLKHLLKGQFPVGIKCSENNPKNFNFFKDVGINVLFGFNIVPEFREYLKKNGILFFLNFSVFHAPQEVEKYPNLLPVDSEGVKEPLDTWQKIVCPSHDDFNLSQIQKIREQVKQIDPDGLSLDFIRYPVYWEKIELKFKLEDMRKFCFCDMCINKFQSQESVLIPAKLKSTKDKSDWILKNCPDVWNDWRCRVIANTIMEISMAAKSIKSNIVIDVHTIPWRQEDFDGAIKSVVGQDFEMFAQYVDVFSPMCYHTMLRRDPEWIHSVVSQMHTLTNKPIWPCIQGQQIYDEPRITTDEFKAAILQALKPPSSGIDVFGLPDDEEKITLYRSLT
jgi:hypothetical protein